MLISSQIDFCLILQVITSRLQLAIAMIMMSTMTRMYKKLLHNSVAAEGIVG